MDVLLIIVIFALGAIILSNAGLIRYRSRVESCCCLSSASTTQLNAVRQQIVWFNTMLPDGYKIYVSEEDIFYAIYQEYRFWLLAKYFSMELSAVSATYHNILSRKNHNAQRDELSKIFGAYLKEGLFMVETMYQFLERHADTWCPEIFHLNVLRDALGNEAARDNINRVVYKLYLACGMMRDISGYPRPRIHEVYKKLIDESLDSTVSTQ